MIMSTFGRSALRFCSPNVWRLLILSLILCMTLQSHCRWDNTTDNIKALLLLSSSQVICLLSIIEKKISCTDLYHTTQAIINNHTGSRFSAVANTLLPPLPLCCLILKTQQLWTWFHTPSPNNYANYWNPYLQRHNSRFFFFFPSLSEACLQEIRRALSTCQWCKSYWS